MGSVGGFGPNTCATSVGWLSPGARETNSVTGWRGGQSHTKKSPVCGRAWRRPSQGEAGGRAGALKPEVHRKAVLAKLSTLHRLDGMA